MKFFIKINILIFICAVNQPLLAQFNYTEKAQQAHNSILSIDFVKFDTIKQYKTDEDKGVFYWLGAYKSFIEFETTSSIIDADTVINQINNMVLLIEGLPHSSPFYYYCSADLHLFLSFVFFEQNEPLKSIQQYLKAKNLIKTRQQIYPDFEFAGKHELIQYFVNSFVNRQMGFSSKTYAELQKEYIDLLQSYLKTENITFKRELKLLGLILFNYQIDSNAEKFIHELNINLEYAKAGPLESLLSSMWYKKADRYNFQYLVLSSANKLGFQQRVNYLNLWYGNALLNRNNDSAIYFINRFLDKQQTPKLIQYARFKASLYWFVKGGVAKSDSLNRLILQTTNIAVAEDKQALYEVGHCALWTKELVLARILFDGGNYKKALGVLLSVKQKVSSYNKKQKLEYSYRLARIYHKLNDIEKAAKFYQMAINSELDSEFYYPAYSAYYLGNMYSKRGKNEKAEKYYTICNRLNSPVYKVSIHKKARQAME